MIYEYNVSYFDLDEVNHKGTKTETTNKQKVLCLTYSKATNGSSLYERQFTSRYIVVRN